MQEHRWLVKSAVGQVRETSAVSRAVCLALWPGCQVRLMGSHETLREAARRVGWEA